MLQSGDVAPLFSLPDADLETFDLSAAVERHHVVLYFYRRDRTPGCTLLATDFTDHDVDFARQGCIVIGISPDDAHSHSEFRDAEGLSVRLLADPDKEVCQRYGVWQEKEVDGVKRMGVRRTTFIIARGGIIRHVLHDVVPRGHAVEVLQLVKKL